LTLVPKSTPYEVRKAAGIWDEYFDSLSRPMQEFVNDKVWNHIRFDPYGNESLNEPLKGLWSYNDSSNGYRIIYAVCEQCRRDRYLEVNGCDKQDCSGIPNRSVKLFACGPHPIYEEFERRNGKRRKKALGKRRQLGGR